MSVRTAPCEWPVSYTECTPQDDDSPIPEPLASMSPSGMSQIEAMAIEYLWRWTGQVLGVCEVTVQPCVHDCTDGMSTFWGSGPQVTPLGAGLWRPVIIDGLWYNVGCGRCGDECGCGGAAPLVLPGPVDQVLTVKEDGTTLDADTYRVDNDSLLVRTDGKTWPRCGLEVTYKRGVAVPAGGRVAAGVLAWELAKAACSDKSCRLPQRVQTVTRQGVSIAMLDAFDDVDKGHTGIWIIDSWVTSMTKIPAHAVVLSPDLPRAAPRRKTWP